MNNTKEIRAFYNKDFIRVYQAYNNTIATSAVKNKRFISPPFKAERATWIKPSFLWMMYRSGWGTKENQERILAIDITHEGFLWALKNSCLSHFDDKVYASQEEWLAHKERSAVVVQWDPERDIHLNKMESRSVQIGLTSVAVQKYISEWIVDINDITDTCKEIHTLITQKKTEEARVMLPVEKVYSYA